MKIIPFLVFIEFALLLGCQNQSPPAQQLPMEEEPVVHPNYLRLPLDGPISTIDPGLSQFLDAIELVEQLFLGLTDFDPETYEVLPELAVNWKVDDEGKVYRFQLREDALWTNDQPVTAHDIVWAIRRNVDPKTESPMVSTLFLIKNAEKLYKGELKDFTLLGVKALDDFNVEFVLERSAAYFPALVSQGIYRPLPKDIVEKYQHEWTLPEHIVTNGSYRLKEWKKGAVMVLEKSPTYYDARNVSIPALHYYIVAESSLGFAMYQGGELDILGGGYLRIPANDLPRIDNDADLRRERQEAPRFCTEAYIFNTQLAPVDNVLVRKAIAMAINRQLLIDFVVKSHQPASTFTRPPIFGSVDPSEKVGIHFNAEQAQALLAEAGYQQGQGFPAITFVHNREETHHANAKAIKTLLKHYLNIELIIREVDFDTYLDTVFDPKETHLFRLGFCADYPDANNWLYENFHPQKSSNFARWDNQEFAQLVEKAQSIADPKERILLYRRAEEILVQEQAAVIPLYFETANYLIKPWIKGWYGMAFGGQHIRNWALQ